MRFVLPTALILALFGCTTEMGALEAGRALEESARSSAGTEATQEPIEISTDFTIGSALEDAAAELGAFWDAQAPCNQVTRDGATITVDWGDLGDGCVHNGHTFAGVTAITVERTAATELEVLHEWFDFHNEDIAVDGSALVTWNSSSLTRRVSTEHTWTEQGGAAPVDVIGDHEFGIRDDASAFTLDGTREWDTEKGAWHLEMEGIDFRLQDPVPEAGKYVVTNPAGNSLELVFSRIDDTTIEAVLLGVRGGDLVYHIGPFGQAERIN